MRLRSVSACLLILASICRSEAATAPFYSAHQHQGQDRVIERARSRPEIELRKKLIRATDD